ncbi:hypothetical protein [Methylobacterium sp. Leaf100]|uniref:hypothetical protein n=1 Tax=Methylobacterium sp. Leaf100 TaxID=1736252 RepID=UPI0012E29843|nr:hypothetical protein [Methylobacterium sp. Leaf100]
MKFARVSVDNAIICDDVRREAGGKSFIIGGWALDFIVPSYPADLTFVVRCEGSVHESGNIQPRIKVLDGNGGILYDSDSSNKMDPSQFTKGRYGIDFPVYVQATRSTTLSFYINMGDEEILAAQRRVELIDVMLKEREVEIEKLNS